MYHFKTIFQDLHLEQHQIIFLLLFSKNLLGLIFSELFHQIKDWAKEVYKEITLKMRENSNHSKQ